MSAHRGQGRPKRNRPPCLTSVSHNRCRLAVTGAVGGFFWACPVLLVELPITTTLMLHSIVEIARSHGEDFLNPESSLACLEVFCAQPAKTLMELRKTAPTTQNPNGVDAGCAGSSVLRHSEGNGERKARRHCCPFLGRIASRFGLEVSEKVAAELISGRGAQSAVSRSMCSFSQHFQSLAEGHFNRPPPGTQIR